MLSGPSQLPSFFSCPHRPVLLGLPRQRYGYWMSELGKEADRKGGALGSDATKILPNAYAQLSL